LRSRKVKTGNFGRVFFCNPAIPAACLSPMGPPLDLVGCSRSLHYAPNGGIMDKLGNGVTIIFRCMTHNCNFFKHSLKESSEKRSILIFSQIFLLSAYR